MEGKITGALGILVAGASLGALLGCSNEAAKHWSAFEQCVVGERVAPTDNVLTRLRSVQLAQVAAGAKGEAWPARCSDTAKQLHDALDTGGKDGMVKRSLSEQLGCSPKCEFPREGLPLPKADELWERARAADYGPISVEGVAAPEKAGKLLGASDVPVLAPEGTTLKDYRVGPSGDTWLLLASAAGKLTFCSVGSAEAVAKCRPLEKAPAFGNEAPVSLAKDADRPVVVGTVESQLSGFDIEAGDVHAAFGEAGREVVAGLTFTQRPTKEPEPTSKEEALAAATPKSEFDVFRVESGKAARPSKLTLKTVVRGPMVVGDWLVYVDRDDEQKPRFNARQAQNAGLGKVSAQFSGTWPGSLSSCTSKNGASLASFVRTQKAFGSAGKSETLALETTQLENGQWSKPFITDIPKVTAQMGAWRCGDGGGAGMSWAEYAAGSLSVAELSCTSAGCEKARTELPLAGLRTVYGLERVGANTLMIYASGMGETSLRSAPLKELGAARTVPLFDTGDYGGLTPSGAVLIAHGDAATFVFQYQGLRALKVKSSGEVTPVSGG